MSNRTVAPALFSLFLLLIPQPSSGQEVAWLENCYDGDTCTFGGLRDTAVRVRLAGIDTPEMDGSCQQRAQRARSVLFKRLRQAQVVRVDSTDVGRYGRIVARVYADTMDTSRMLLRRGLAARYPDGEPCPAGAQTPGPSPDRGPLPYDPDGPDRDCGDFDAQPVAQRFFEAAGGPRDDPHRLDGDGDGVACENLPGGGS